MEELKNEDLEKNQNEPKITKRKRQFNKKIIIYFVIFLVALYLIYTIYLLVKQPTDIFTLEEGTLYSEETDVG